MPNLEDQNAGSLAPEVEHCFGPQLRALSIPRLMGGDSLMMTPQTPVTGPVNIVFAAVPLVNGRPSSTNLTGNTEFLDRAPYPYDMAFWDRQLQHRTPTGKPEIRFIELGAMIPECSLVARARPPHMEATVTYGPMGPFVGQYASMCLYGAYAVCFKVFMQTSMCQLARRNGWMVLFALKRGLVTLGVGQVKKYRVVSCDRNGSSFLSLIGFWKQNSQDKADYSYIGVSNNGFPLTTREIQLSLEAN
jgi:hypothetical protein